MRILNLTGPSHDHVGGTGRRRWKLHASNPPFVRPSVLPFTTPSPSSGISAGMSDVWMVADLLGLVGDVERVDTNVVRPAKPVGSAPTWCRERLARPGKEGRPHAG